MKPSTEGASIAARARVPVADAAFDDALAAAGDNRTTWLVLLAVKFRAGRTQAVIADEFGVSGSTIIDQLNRLEAAGRNDQGEQ